MSLIGDIQTTLSSVVQQNFADTTLIEYRVMTSNPNANPRTWSAWTSLAGARTTEAGEEQTFDERTGQWRKEDLKDLRVPSGLGVTLGITYQIRLGGSGGTIWNVKSQIPNGVAVLLYRLASTKPLLGDPRPGGV